MKPAPVNNNVPPLEELYQYNCPEPVAESDTVPGPQRLTLAETGTAGMGSMIACIAVRVALGQPLSDST